ncbi:hypothetical protein SAMN05444166_0945 [Singulisphaera sp. GP187]|nr:hypothetical protein SAMN05444166_0945 [Singulisphaera sp. GP187]
MTELYVLPGGPRPDYRLVLAFVWGDDANCDTEGDSQHPADREWTELYAQKRSRPDEVFDVSPVGEHPLVLKVESSAEWLAAVVASMLAESSAGSVSDDPCGPFNAAKLLLDRMDGFDIGVAWARYWGSPFQKATADNPYPNLK